MKRYTMETVVGIFVAVGIVCISYMTIKLGDISIFTDNHYRLLARFPSVSGLRVGSPVEVHGIEVGTVEDLSIEPERDMAVVRMKVRKGVTVFDDGSAAIKTAGLIGDKLVKVEPGGSGEPLTTGGWITETSSPIDIEEIIGKFAFGDVEAKAKTEE